ncbi:RBBP9/YdeN family alpha/beta hydrolase [Aquariibacter albus]|uniref:Serine hydrolase family protein n=1 Tax=Aquariibacter albus TaxID=2759899 RepID=A0A839HNC3_9BURK|nr:alpha/beta fold hydrolase [Aquariibacter albus]MBB1162952.1 serine hydrolase family protein [Aquariibacter albus]
MPAHPLALPILSLPGWGGSGPGHWQSRWEALHGDQRVEQADWRQPLRGDWMMRLEETLLSRSREELPVLLVAHSLGCHLVAAWASHSRNTGRVAGAFLVAPPDLERDPLPPQLHSWRPVQRLRLPFPALLVASSNDEVYCALPQALALAEDWGAEVREAGALGHVNADSGLGDWPQGRAWLNAWAARLPASR